MTVAKRRPNEPPLPWAARTVYNGNSRLVDRTALYAGESLHRIHDVIPAAEAVARLTP
ncbi:MAG TPA: hypothetical protein VFQ88_06420 [Nevskiaceae bacterium]|nr:hypothetical protein [Nevskiaceae bacterium]